MEIKLKSEAAPNSSTYIHALYKGGYSFFRALVPLAFAAIMMVCLFHDYGLALLFVTAFWANVGLFNLHGEKQS
jgi:hypothetical protein